MKKKLLLSLLVLSLLSSFLPAYAEKEALSEEVTITETEQVSDGAEEKASEDTEIAEKKTDAEASESEDESELAENDEVSDIAPETQEEEPQEEENKGFIKVFVECPEMDRMMKDSYYDYSHLLLRYADDKTPIALSATYDGRIWATIPAENAERPLEYFIAEEKTFTDAPDTEEYDETSFNFYIMSVLSARNIIEGNELGEALPFNNVTRAEAVAMTMRFLGVDNMPDTDSGFSDVAEDAWYAAAVTKARKLGIVAGDDETHFSPMRNVSREETVALIARCLWASGLQKELPVTREELAEDVNFADGDEIADWALSAYNTLKTYGTADYVYDYEDEDSAPLFYAHPKDAATRFFAAYVILDACDIFQIYPSKTAIEFGFDQNMPKIDGSTSTYPFTEAVYGKLFSSGVFSSDMPQKHSKSHASYERLINGEIDMIFASVYPARDILQLAKENGVELELIPIAYDAMIFFTNMDNPIKGLSSKQISDIYVNNNYSNWKDLGGTTAKLYPYCRNNDSGSHAQMERYFLNGNEINSKIRRENTSYAMENILTDVMSSQTENPKGYGLGYSIYYYFQNMNEFYDTNEYLKLLEIDGVYPDDETIASGEYPLSNNTYLVLRKDEPEGSPARKMAEFMLTKEGQSCVEEAGFGALTPPNPKEFNLRNTSYSFQLYAEDGKTPIIDTSVRYPQISSKKTPNFIGKINQTFTDIVEDFEAQIRSYKDSIIEYYDECEEEERDIFPFDNYLYYTVTKNTDGIFSITFDASVYMGGAHPYGDRISFTYDTKNRKTLTLSDILGTKSQEDTDKFVIEKFTEEFEGYELWDLEEEAPFVSFYLYENELVLYFQQYQIGPYSMGFPEVRIELDDLKK